MCKRCCIKDFLSSSLLLRLSYDFFPHIYPDRQMTGRGSAKEQGLEKEKDGWENDGEMLRSPPLRRVCESAPWGTSTAAEQSSRGERRERRGRQNRHLLLLVPTAWLEQNSGTGVWILELPFAEHSAEQIESYEEKGWETEESRQILPLSQCHFSCSLIFSPSFSFMWSFFYVLFYSVAVEQLSHKSSFQT